MSNSVGTSDMPHDTDPILIGLAPSCSPIRDTWPTLNDLPPPVGAVGAWRPARGSMGGPRCSRSGSRIPRARRGIPKAAAQCA